MNFSGTHKKPVGCVMTRIQVFDKILFNLYPTIHPGIYTALVDGSYAYVERSDNLLSPAIEEDRAAWRELSPLEQLAEGAE